MLRNLDRLDALKISEKSHNDFVKVDHQCEVAVIDTIRKAYLDHGFLGEEGGQQGEGDNMWIIDPLTARSTIYAVSHSLRYLSPSNTNTARKSGLSTTLSSKSCLLPLAVAAHA